MTASSLDKIEPISGTHVYSHLPDSRTYWLAVTKVS